MFHDAVRRGARWAVLCAALAVFGAAAAWADYGAGRAAWEAGRHPEALAEWRAAADAGDARAMLSLGRAFVKGLGAPQDYVEAHKWLNLAAGLGSAEAAAERDALAKEMTAEERAEAAAETGAARGAETADDAWLQAGSGERRLGPALG